MINPNYDKSSLTQEDLLEAIVENPNEAVIFIDGQGIIRLINRNFAEFFGYQTSEMLNQPLLEVVPQSRLLEVLKSGKPEFGDILTVKGQKFVVTRLPIFKNGQIIGVLGRTMFRDKITLALDFVQKIKHLEDELTTYKTEQQKKKQAKYDVNNIIGHSDWIITLKKKVYKVAKTTSTVLITGESGTGKELFAHAIHNASPRINKPFVRVNCTSIPMDLLESELFGYEDGAFTGAKRGGKLGKFEIAQGGTIFLDEIGDMNCSMQAKLLRVLQEKEIERIGGTTSVSVDVRIIAATNRNLEEMILKQQFREDLYYRLNVILLRIPPLRERKKDIAPLIEHFIQKLNKKLGTEAFNLGDEVLDLFMQYDWPGNVRELENFLEQAINLSEQNILYPKDFPILEKRLKKQLKGFPQSFSVKPLHQAVKEAETKAILKALSVTGYNKKEAARLLGIHRSVLYRKLTLID